MEYLYTYFGIGLLFVFLFSWAIYKTKKAGDQYKFIEVIFIITFVFYLWPGVVGFLVQQTIKEIKKTRIDNAKNKRSLLKKRKRRCIKRLRLILLMR